MAEKPTPQSVHGTENSQFEKCQRMIRRSLQTSKVKFLREQMEKAGCGIRDSFFRPAYCHHIAAGFFHSGKGIAVCCNHMRIQDDVNQAVIHELIHAYDDCRAKNLDWSNCAHHACAEIRAAHLSGDCHYIRELMRGFMKLKGHEPECVRRRVMKSMQNNPKCSKAVTENAIEFVWDICYNDTQPFDRAP